MKKFHSLLSLLAVWLYAGTLSAQLNPPVIYSESNITSTGQGFYETFNCAFQGVDVWADSSYSAYFWSTGATTPRISVMPNFNMANDTLTLRVADMNGNMATSTVVLQYVQTMNQNVLYSNTPDVCAGNQIDLFTWIDGGYYLVWSWGDTIRQESDCDLSLNPGDCVMFRGTSGNYTYRRYENATGCWYNGFNIFGTVVPTPPQPTITQSMDTLYANGGGPDYQWYDGNQSPIAGATNNWYKPTVGGNYYVESIDPQLGLDCSSGLAGPYSFVLNSRTEPMAPAFRIFPNPTTGKLVLEGESAIQKLRVLDATGRELLSRMAQVSAIDLSAFSAGTYWIWVETRQGSHIQKIMKQ